MGDQLDEEDEMMEDNMDTDEQQNDPNRCGVPSCSRRYDHGPELDCATCAIGIHAGCARKAGLQSKPPNSWLFCTPACKRAKEKWFKTPVHLRCNVMSCCKLNEPPDANCSNEPCNATIHFECADIGHSLGSRDEPYCSKFCREKSDEQQGPSDHPGRLLASGSGSSHSQEGGTLQASEATEPQQQKEGMNMEGQESHPQSPSQRPFEPKEVHVTPEQDHSGNSGGMEPEQGSEIEPTIDEEALAKATQKMGQVASTDWKDMCRKYYDRNGFPGQQEKPVSVREAQVILQRSLWLHFCNGGEEDNWLAWLHKQPLVAIKTVTDAALEITPPPRTES